MDTVPRCLRWYSKRSKRLDIVWSQSRDSLGSCARTVIYDCTDGVTPWYFIKSSSVDWRQKSPACRCEYPANVSHLNPDELESCWNPSCSCFLAPFSGFLSLLSLCPGPSQLFRAFQTAENGQDVVVPPVILFFTAKRKTFRVFWCWNKGRRNVIITSPPVWWQLQSVENGWRGLMQIQIIGKQCFHLFHTERQ